MDKGNTQTLASCWSVNGNIEILWPGHKSGNTPHLLLTLPIDLRSYQQRPETAAPLRHAGGAPVSSLIVQGLVHHWWELSELLWMVSKVIPVQPPMTPLSLLSQARVPRLQNNKTIAKCSQLRACGNVIGINHHLFLENWTLDLGLNTLVPVMPLMNRCCLIALTYEGRVSGLGVWNSCSFQLIFNYPGSHEGGYRRGRAGRRAGVQTVRPATWQRWNSLKIVSGHQLLLVSFHIILMVNVRTGFVCLVLLFLVPLRWLRPRLERAGCQ